MNAQVQEQADDVLLVVVHVADLADVELVLAQLAYRGRALFIGGQCLPWGLLTPGQRAEYVAEARGWIRGGL